MACVGGSTTYPDEGEPAGAIIMGTGHQPGFLLSIMMGIVKRIDLYEHLLIMMDGKKIRIESICKLGGEIFDELE